jgi:hypothetical protein
MNEKTLFLICFVISILILIFLQKRIKKSFFVIGLCVLPFLIYAIVLILIIILALIYGDK